MGWTNFIKLQKWLKMAVLLDLEGQIIIPFFNFLLITSKYTKKHHIKKSDEFIHCNIIQVQKTAKIARMANFGPIRPNCDPFFHDFLQMTSKEAQKHHIK